MKWLILTYPCIYENTYIPLVNQLTLKLSKMKTETHNLQIGSKLYWVDAPDTLAGTVVRFTPKRDVVINFVSGRELGERNFQIKLAKDFIIK